MTTFTLYTATSAGQAINTIYPNQVVVTTPAELEAACRLDHVATVYQGNQRSN